MLLEINAKNPDARKIQQAVEVLKNGGIIIYPTDTVYGIGCDITNQKAVEKICRLRGLDPVKANLSFICKDISQVSDFTQQIENRVYKLMNRNLPGAFTFILNSNKQIPKLFRNKKRTVGVRIPDNQIVLDLVTALGRPILTTSLKNDDEILEYFTDPIDIYDDFKNQVNLVINGGIGGNVASTVVNCTGDEVEVIREGAAELVW